MRLPTSEWFCGDHTEHSFNSTLLEKLQEQTILEFPTWGACRDADRATLNR